MNSTVASQTQSSLTSIGNGTLIGNIVDVLYDKLFDDYRVNCFYSVRPVADRPSR